MDADIWSRVLPHMSFSELCFARGTARAARSAYVPIEDLIIRRRTTENGASFALAVRQHVLTPHSRLLTLVLHHIPLGGEGAMHLSRGYFDSLQLLDITNCAVTDIGAAQLIWKTKDVPILVLDRNPLAELAFDALMHKYFHLSAVAGEEFVVAIRNLPQMLLTWIRMLTWGLLQITTSTVEAHCTHLDKVSMALFQQASAPNRTLFGNRKTHLKPTLLDMTKFQGLPVCTNLRIRIHVPLIALPAPLAAPPAPLAPLTAAPRVLPKDRNARRKLPLPHDTTCQACGHVWKKDSITISQCETFRSQCKVHNRLCVTRHCS